MSVYFLSVYSYFFSINDEFLNSELFSSIRTKFDPIQGTISRISSQLIPKVVFTAVAHRIFHRSTSLRLVSSQITDTGCPPLTRSLSSSFSCQTRWNVQVRANIVARLLHYATQQHRVNRASLGETFSMTAQKSRSRGS